MAARRLDRRNLYCVDTFARWLGARHALLARADLFRRAGYQLYSRLGLTLWHNIPPADVRTARIGTGALWALAALVSLTTLEVARELRGKDV